MSELPGLHQISITDIEIGERLRPVDRGYVGLLMDSIEKSGLLQPIVVRGQLRGERRYRLIAGLHRLSACVSLGWRELPAIVKTADDLQAELAEADENLIRHELNSLDRAVALAERKAIYEALFPETRNGAQGGRGGKKNESDKMSFSKDAAKKTGLNKRSIERSVKLLQGLQPDIVERLKGTRLASNQALLTELSNVPAAQQGVVLALMLRPENPAKRVRDAQAEAAGLSRETPTALVRRFKSFEYLWRKGGQKLQRAIIAFIEQDMDGEFVLMGDAPIAAEDAEGDA